MQYETFSLILSYFKMLCIYISFDLSCEYSRKSYDQILFKSVKVSGVSILNFHWSNDSGYDPQSPLPG